MKNKKNKQQFTDEEILEAVRKFVLNAKKGKGKKQKLATAGQVDPKTPSIDTEGMTDDTIEKALQSAIASLGNGEGSDSVGGSGGSSVASSISGIIGAVTEIADAAGGEADQYGSHGSDIETYLSRSSDIGGNIETGIDEIKDGDILTGIGNILQLGGAMNVSEDKEVEEAKQKREEKLLSNASAVKREERAFKDGGNVDDDPKKKETKSVAGKSTKSQAEINRRYPNEPNETTFFSPQEAIQEMDALGYQPAGEDRSDRLQGGYELTPELKPLYDRFETKDIQDYLISQGADLQNFGEDNVFGIETGDSFIRYLEQRNPIDPIDPVAPGELDSDIPEPELSRANEMKRVMYFSPSGNVYYGEPDKQATGKERAKKFKRANENELISYADEVGLSTSEARELLKKENGVEELVNKINKKQGIGERMQKAYLSQSEFPRYGDGKFQEFKHAFDEEGNFTFTEDDERYAEGGEIKGKGTGKSDDISADIPAGSFIIPADAPKESVNALMDYLGYDDSNAKIKQPDGVSVKVSDGEYYIPEEDTARADMFAKKLGYKEGLNGLAPNAKTQYSPGGLADGGFMEENAGTLGGSLQLLLANMVSQQSEEPESNTAEMLKSLSSEVRMRSSYGLDPYERTQAENQIKNSMAKEADMIKAISGGSIDVAMNNMAASTMRGNQGILNLETASEQKRMDKERYADDISMKAIMANERDFERKYNNYMRKEEGIAGLTQAGIGNIIGQSQFNRTSQIMEDDNTNEANWWKTRGQELINSATKSEGQKNNEKKSETERIVKSTDWIRNQEENPYY